MEELVEEFISKKGKKFKDMYGHSWTECIVRTLIEDVITYYLHNYVGVQTEFFDYEELLKQYNEECIDGFNLFKKSYKRNKKNYGIKQLLKVAPNFFIDTHFKTDTNALKVNVLNHVMTCQVEIDKNERRYTELREKYRELRKQLRKENKETESVDDEYFRELDLLMNKLFKRYIKQPTINSSN